jgi:protein HOOK3
MMGIQANDSPPPTGLRAERDKLIQENDDLRSRCEQMITQIAEITSNLARIL